jgi:hypothetical protein
MVGCLWVKTLALVGSSNNVTLVSLPFLEALLLKPRRPLASRSMVTCARRMLVCSRLVGIPVMVCQRHPPLFICSRQRPQDFKFIFVGGSHFVVIFGCRLRSVLCLYCKLVTPAASVCVGLVLYSWPVDDFVNSKLDSLSLLFKQPIK